MKLLIMYGTIFSISRSQLFTYWWNCLFLWNPMAHKVHHTHSSTSTQMSHAQTTWYYRTQEYWHHL